MALSVEKNSRNRAKTAVETPSGPFPPKQKCRQIA